MVTELQSSEAPRVTTETTIGSPAGEYSKQSFAHRSEPIQTTSTPASKVAEKRTLTVALNRN